MDRIADEARQDLVTKTDVKVEKIIEDHTDLVLLKVYKILHEGRGFRMDGIEHQIRKELRKELGGK